VAAALPENIWQVTPSGRLDEAHAGQLAMLLNEQLEAGHHWLVVNMEEVDFISSAGLKTLVSVWQRARDQKGELVLTALKPRVREVLEMIGLDLVFKISQTPDQARRYLAAKRK
jgi:anti-anti-sigma factor